MYLIKFNFGNTFQCNGLYFRLKLFLYLNKDESSMRFKNEKYKRLNKKKFNSIQKILDFYKYIFGMFILADKKLIEKIKIYIEKRRPLKKLKN